MGVQQDLEFELADLVAVFGLPTHLSDRERKTFWFRHRRADGIETSLSFSVYERQAGLIVELGRDKAGSSIHLTDCSSIKVLDVDRKIVEVISNAKAIRCILALEADTILEINA